jgi:hypothetical protein
MPRKGLSRQVVQKQLDPKAVQRGREADRVLQGAPEAIDGPDHQHIELPLGRISTQRIECGALVASSRLPRMIKMLVLSLTGFGPERKFS